VWGLIATQGSVANTRQGSGAPMIEEGENAPLRNVDMMAIIPFQQRSIYAPVIALYCRMGNRHDD